jgi:Helicase associated domain
MERQYARPLPADAITRLIIPPPVYLAPALHVAIQPWTPHLRTLRLQPFISLCTRQPQAALDPAIDGPRSTQTTPQFPDMVAQLTAWRAQYYDCNVPRNVHDAAPLGEWTYRQRRARSKGTLSPDAIATLDALGFEWTPDVVTAKWHANFHSARHYQEVHKALIEPTEAHPPLPPPDYVNPDRPEWVEAGRWLERQHELYRRQKLSIKRVRLLKEVLGVKLSRPRGPLRRNVHEALQRQDREFAALKRVLAGKELDQEGSFSG